MAHPTVAFARPPQASGGPGTFQLHFEEQARARGWSVTYPDSQQTPDVILLVTGTRHVAWLRRMRRRGAKLLLRLDGVLWRHRLPGAPVRLRALHAFRNLAADYHRLRADAVVYQSDFIKREWQRRGLRRVGNEFVIYNGTSTERFLPAPSRGSGGLHLLCVEGTVLDDAPTRAMLEWARARVADGSLARVTVCGECPASLLRTFHAEPRMRFFQQVPREQMPEIFASADAYLSLELNPPCPNAVVEALASGLPVLGFRTGALPELVGDEGGVLADYVGGRPERLEPPDTRLLDAALAELRVSLDRLRSSARKRAEDRFTSSQMFEAYARVIASLTEEARS